MSSGDEQWKRSLVVIDRAAAKLRLSFDAFLAGTGRTPEVREHLSAVLAAIPADVLDQAQHPLSVAAKDLRGSVQQALDGRKLVQGTDVPEWLEIVDDGARTALDAFEQALAKLLKSGSAEH